MTHAARQLASRALHELGAAEIAAAGEAPRGSRAVAHPYVYIMWTALHVPSITLPVLRCPNGLPIGVQRIARRYEDRKLFAVARWVQRVLRES